MKLKPLGDRVVIQVNAEETTTSSGIVLPGSAQEKPQQGKIIAVGSGEVIDGKKVPLDVKVGDEVIYSKYSGSEVKVGDDKYLIVKQSDILAIVE
ncbi:MAG: co-chaperone GroES [Eubacteriaceae bacterium]|nr:co-chaperone GroES [Eubacteriaceae bacterium]MBR0383188.1 co-chaperone GroES [Eubacteriaceae bacterium]